jgi:hypothetical protein
MRVFWAVASASGDWAVGKIHVILGTIKLLSQQESSPWNLVRPFLNEANIVRRERSALLSTGSDTAVCDEFDS